MALRTTNYATVLQSTADICALDRSNIATGNFQVIRSAHNEALQSAWEYDLWPELIRLEKRYYRDLYAAGTTYAAPTTTTASEVYFPDQSKYYQALKSTIGLAPANASGVVNSAAWAESGTSYNSSAFAAATTYAVGDKVRYLTTDRFYALHTSAVAGTLPTDTTKWGILTEFDRYVATSQTGLTALGNIHGVWSLSPKLTTRGDELGWYLSENGIQITTPSSYAWVNYRIRTVSLYGDAYSATTVYTANVSQVYYSDSATPGNFYNCIVTTTAGQSPITTPTSWSVVNIPLIFERYLILRGAATYFLYDDDQEKSQMNLALADQHLADQSFLLCGQQLQSKRTVCYTR